MQKKSSNDQTSGVFKVDHYAVNIDDDEVFTLKHPPPKIPKKANKTCLQV